MGHEILLHARKKGNYNHSGPFEILSKKSLPLQTPITFDATEVKNKIIWWFVIIFEVIDNYIMIFVPSLETSEVKYLEKVIKSWEK